MANIRVPDALREELASMELVLWIAQHPLEFNYEVGGQKGRGRADKTRVQVQITGVGLGDFSPWGYGPNLRAAVDDALRHPSLVGRVGGLKGAIMRLDAALDGLTAKVRWERIYTEGGVSWEERDDYVPF